MMAKKKKSPQVWEINELAEKYGNLPIEKPVETVKKVIEVKKYSTRDTKKKKLD